MFRRNRRRTGNATVEMTLVGIPIIFALISIFEMARGMWVYQTMAHALKEGARYAAVHGSNCGLPNTCAGTVGNVANVIKNAGVGLDGSSLMITMACTGCATMAPTSLNNLIGSATLYPTGAGAQQQQPLTLTATYPFRSAIAMFWPGAGTGVLIPLVTFPASAQESVQF